MKRSRNEERKKKQKNGAKQRKKRMKKDFKVALREIGTQRKSVANYRTLPT